MTTTRREFRSTGIAIGSDTKPSALNAPLQSERDEDEMAAGVRKAAKKVPSGVVDAVAVRMAGPQGCAMVLLCSLAIATLSNGDGGEGASTHTPLPVPARLPLLSSNELCAYLWIPVGLGGGYSTSMTPDSPKYRISINQIVDAVNTWHAHDIVRWWGSPFGTGTTSSIVLASLVKIF